MPHVSTHPQLPFSGRSPIARHCSYQAAVRAANGRAQKSMRYLSWLKTVGRASDHEAALHFGWGLSSINSIRNGLGDRVRPAGIKASPFGRRKRTQWEAVS